MQCTCQARDRLAPVTAKRPDTSAIRAWARAHGHQISDRGRIAAEVLKSFHADQPGSGAGKARFVPRGGAGRCRFIKRVSDASRPAVPAGQVRQATSAVVVSPATTSRVAAGYNKRHTLAGSAVAHQLDPVAGQHPQPATTWTDEGPFQPPCERLVTLVGGRPPCSPLPTSEPAVYDGTCRVVGVAWGTSEQQRTHHRLRR
jgi:hypothetical protein